MIPSSKPSLCLTKCPVCSDQPDEMHKVSGPLLQSLQIAFVLFPHPFCLPSSQVEGKVGGTEGEFTYSFLMGVSVHTQELFNTESLSLGSDRIVHHFSPL